MHWGSNRYELGYNPGYKQNILKTMTCGVKNSAKTARL